MDFILFHASGGDLKAAKWIEWNVSIKDVILWIAIKNHVTESQDPG